MRLFRTENILPVGYPWNVLNTKNLHPLSSWIFFKDSENIENYATQCKGLFLNIFKILSKSRKGVERMAKWIIWLVDDVVYFFLSDPMSVWYIHTSQVSDIESVWSDKWVRLSLNKLSISFWSLFRRYYWKVDQVYCHAGQQKFLSDFRCRNHYCTAYK